MKPCLNRLLETTFPGHYFPWAFTMKTLSDKRPAPQILRQPPPSPPCWGLYIPWPRHVGPLSLPQENPLGERQRGSKAREREDLTRTKISRQTETKKQTDTKRETEKKRYTEREETEKTKTRESEKESEIEKEIQRKKKGNSG